MGVWGLRPQRVQGGALAFLLLLTACGSLPQPFRGEPGATASRLSQPPPGRLTVETPAGALLTDQASAAYAVFLARSLQDHELPAFGPEAPRPREATWTLRTTASQRQGKVVPSFEVLDPSGHDQGHTDGSPVSAQAWASADLDALHASAAEAAPRIVDLMNTINATRMQSDPNSLYNRPARVFVPDVVGAPGDGNVSLTAQMRRALVKLNEVVQDTATGADFTVAGHVAAVPIAGGMVRVEIRWLMSDAAGHDLGMVLQLNEVTPDSVNGYWADVAVAVATEAAGGVRDTFARQSGRAAPKTAASAPAKPPADLSAPPASVATP